MKIISFEQPDDGNFSRYGSLSLDDAVEVIEEILLLHHSDVIGLQKFGVSPRKIHIGVTNDAFWRNSVQRFIDETARVSSGRIILMCLPNQAGVTDVYVKHAPMDWLEDRFIRFFPFMVISRK